MTAEKDYLKVNRELWNAKVPYHVESDFYQTEQIIRGADALIGPELELLPDIKGKRVLHLQCHFGLDSIHLARLGAKVTGVDLSDQAIEKARELSAKAGVEIDFICSDVYSVPKLDLEPFDLVFSTYGTIGWLPDMQQWAGLVEDCLRPGGQLLLAEFHPQLWMYDDQFAKLDYSYFNTGRIELASEGTYAQKDADIQAREISWNHPLSEVIQALLEKRMDLTHFMEYDYSPYNCFANTIQIEKYKFQIKGMEGVLPMMYTLLAQKKV